MLSVSPFRQFWGTAHQQATLDIWESRIYNYLSGVRLKMALGHNLSINCPLKVVGLAVLKNLGFSTTGRLHFKAYNGSQREEIWQSSQVSIQVV